MKRIKKLTMEFFPSAAISCERLLGRYERAEIFKLSITHDSRFELPADLLNAFKTQHVFSPASGVPGILSLIGKPEIGASIV